MLLSEIQFHAEIPTITPAEVEFEPAALIIYKWKAKSSIPTYRPIPAAIRICNLIGKASDPCEGLVSDPDDVMIEIMERIAQMPHEISAVFALTIGRWRNRIIGIFKPPDGIQFFPGAEFVARRPANYVG